MKTLTHFVAGEPFAGSGERFGDLYNPATAEVTARVPLASEGAVAAAVAAAKAAFPAWGARPLLRAAAGGASARGGAAGRSVERAARREGGRRRFIDTFRRGSRQLRRVDADRAARVLDGVGARQARPGAGGREESSRGHA